MIIGDVIYIIESSRSNIIRFWQSSDSEMSRDGVLVL